MYLTWQWVFHWCLLGSKYIEANCERFFLLLRFKLFQIHGSREPFEKGVVRDTEMTKFQLAHSNVDCRAMICFHSMMLSAGNINQQQRISDTANLFLARKNPSWSLQPGEETERRSGISNSGTKVTDLVVYHCGCWWSIWTKNYSDQTAVVVTWKNGDDSERWGMRTLKSETLNWGNDVFAHWLHIGDEMSESSWWFQIVFIFTPKFGENFQFHEYFSKGLKPPTSKLSKLRVISHTLRVWRYVV